MKAYWHDGDKAQTLHKRKDIRERLVRILWATTEAECVAVWRKDFSLRRMRLVRTSSNTAPAVSANQSRSKEEKTDMARRKLTEQEMLKGVEKALASKRCPPQLKAGLQRRAESLRKQLGLEPKPRRSGLLALFRK
jgi:hypothetical protein